MYIFRYPGGKSKLAKKIIPYFSEVNSVISENSSFTFHDAFVGGGGMLINVLKTYPNAKFVINDKDEKIYSFWKLLTDDYECNLTKLYKLLRQQPTVKLFKQLRKKEHLVDDIVTKAYYAIFFNKTTFSGMYNAGPIGGYDQKGKWKIDCYYKPEKLIDRIKKLRKLLYGRLKVYNEDIFTFLKRVKYDGILYLDPPYYKKGKDLYPVFMTPEQHGDLSCELMDKKNWILSYDCNPNIDDLYRWAKRIPIVMTKHINIGKNDNCEKIKEYIILPKGD